MKGENDAEKAGATTSNEERSRALKATLTRAINEYGETGTISEASYELFGEILARQVRKDKNRPGLWNPVATVDLSQEAVIQLFQRIDEVFQKCGTPAQLRAYLNKTAANRVASALRHQYAAKRPQVVASLNDESGWIDDIVDSRVTDGIEGTVDQARNFVSDLIDEAPFGVERRAAARLHILENCKAREIKRRMKEDLAMRSPSWDTISRDCEAIKRQFKEQFFDRDGHEPDDYDWEDDDQPFD